MANNKEKDYNPFLMVNKNILFSKLDPYEKILLLVIDSTESETLSHTHLIRLTGFTKTAVIKVIKRLEEKGILVVIRHADENGACFTNEYMINFESLRGNK